MALVATKPTAANPVEHGVNDLRVGQLELEHYGYDVRNSRMPAFMPWSQPRRDHRVRAAQQRGVQGQECLCWLAAESRCAVRTHWGPKRTQGQGQMSA